MKSILVSGSSGLIGSEVVKYFCDNGFRAHGADNNMRADFFGPLGDARWNQRRLEREYKNFTHHEIDLRDRGGVEALVKLQNPDAIVHCAAQPPGGVPVDETRTLIVQMMACSNFLLLH
jgi:CDP-paratose 2-epimerase